LANGVADHVYTAEKDIQTLADGDEADGSTNPLPHSPALLAQKVVVVECVRAHWLWPNVYNDGFADARDYTTEDPSLNAVRDAKKDGAAGWLRTFIVDEVKDSIEA